MTMQTRIGKTQLWVNRIGMGANAVGGHNVYGPQDEQQGRALLHIAVENGFNFFDTAFIYGPERSEILTGEVIREMGVRDQVVLATKGAYRISGEEVTLDNSPAFLRQCVEDSLRRLQTDYIDLFYIHQPDEKTPKDEAVGALQELKEEGKIRAIGVSNFSLAQLQEADKDGYVEVLQCAYSLLDRSAEKELLPFCTARDISFVPYFPLACGLLGGKYTPDTTFSDHRASNPMFQGENYTKNLARIEELRPLAAAHGVEVSHVALAWCLTRNSIDTIIPGAKTGAQLKSNLRTDELQLTEDEIVTIDRLFLGSD